MEHSKHGGFAAVSGSLSGAIAMILVQPLDVVKTRQQQKNLEKYRHFFGAFRVIIKEEGIRALWKGTIPGLWRVVPGAGLNFFALDQIVNFMKRTNHTEELSAFASGLAGSLARTFSTLAVLPFTVVKTRFEGYGTNQYQGTIHALRHVFQTEGIQGLYRGTTACLLRDVPFSGIYYLFYSQLKQKSKLTFGDDLGPLFSLVNGFISGSLATIITHPADVIRTRLQIVPANSIQKEIVYKGTLDVFFRILKEEGFVGFFRGAIPRLLRRPISNAVTWTIYEQIVKFLNATQENFFASGKK